MVEEEKGKEAETVFTGTKARVEQEDARSTRHTRATSTRTTVGREPLPVKEEAVLRARKTTQVHTLNTHHAQGCGGGGGRGGGVCVE